MSLSSFSQILSKKKNKDFIISEQGYGMLVDGIDTFAVVHITYIKDANGILIERNYYRDLSDSLKAVNVIMKDVNDNKNTEIEDLSKQIDKYKNITDLKKEEVDDCGEKYEKLSKKYKRAKNGNKFLGSALGVAGIVILALLI